MAGLFCGAVVAGLAAVRPEREPVADQVGNLETYDEVDRSWEAHCLHLSMSMTPLCLLPAPRMALSVLHVCPPPQKALYYKAL